ncbi:MAG: hypothetical protein EOR40_19700 [Mesorhizobium sp.]|nr:MAG: hypothetical protein EOR40_19700 [Mesorhizobium sp.]
MRHKQGPSATWPLFLLGFSVLFAD